MKVTLVKDYQKNPRRTFVRGTVLKVTPTFAEELAAAGYIVLDDKKPIEVEEKVEEKAEEKVEEPAKPAPKRKRVTRKKES